MSIELRDLQHMDLAALEQLYERTPLMRLPRGRFDGTTLRRLDTPGARRTVHRITQRIAFEWTSWGIDFDQARWFFVHPDLRLGHFSSCAGPSRWRRAETHALRYDVSRIPWVGDALYDEVKPLNDTLCLGIGGVNAATGDGDHFYFALARLRE